MPETGYENVSTIMTTNQPEIVIFDAALIEEREYWISKLSGLTVNTYLGLDHERPQTCGRSMNVLDTTLPEPLTRQLTKLTGGSAFLLYSVLVSGIKVCLHKCSGHRTIIVGAPSLQASGPEISQTRSNLLTVVDEI